MGQTEKTKKKKSKHIGSSNGGDGGDYDGGQQSRLEDRFAAAETRPHFRTPTQRSNKVVLDDRFVSVLTDPRFQLDEKDKYGRKTKKKSTQWEEEANNNEKSEGVGRSKKKNTKNKKHSSKIESSKEDLKAFYVIDDETKGNKIDGSSKGNSKHARDCPSSDDDSDDSDDNDDRDESSDEKDEKQQRLAADSDTNDKVLETPESRIAYLSALSRGELDVSSSSSDDDDDSSSSSSDDSDGDDDDGGEEPVYGTAGVLDPSSRQDDEDEIEVSYDQSPYLVVTNMDWENIRAVDLFAIMSSFSPPGSVKNVRVFQSDFGMERMAQDKLQGPADIWKKKKKKRGSLKMKHARSEDDEFDEDNDSHSSADDESDLNDDSSDDQSISAEGAIGLRIEEDALPEESDFDPEKLRAYEASKLKYYFGIVEFSHPDHSDIAYREVDGMEFEHSSAAVDLRTIAPEDLSSVVDNRPLRDEATSIPSSYEPPEFVVSALQQTNVQCTWDQGDTERERKLTSYHNWQNMDEMDDLKAYLASDASSDESDESDGSDDEGAHGKGSRMRKLLGLDSDDDDQGGGSDKDSAKYSNQSQDSEQESGDSDENDDDDESDDSDGKDENMSMTMKFIPGKQNLEEKIRSKLKSNDEPTELTPWQKYQERRKERRRERRQAARGRKRFETGGRGDVEMNDVRNKTRSNLPKKTSGSSSDVDNDQVAEKEKVGTDQLELLLAGEHNEELARDFDIRGIQRLEKNKDKKFTGSRKRKEAMLTSDIAGTDFKVNVQDDRFRAVLDGTDDRFGIDKTDPSYKDTSAMREILSEQTKRRKKKRQKMTATDSVPTKKAVPLNVSVDDKKQSAGASALSSLVKRMKQRM